MQGISRYAAVLDILEKCQIDATIIAHSRTITRAAPKSRWAPKKTIDQSAFRTSWTAKTASAFLTSRFPGPFSGDPPLLSALVRFSGLF